MVFFCFSWVVVEPSLEGVDLKDVNQTEGVRELAQTVKSHILHAPRFSVRSFQQKHPREFSLFF